MVHRLSDCKTLSLWFGIRGYPPGSMDAGTRNDILSGRRRTAAAACLRGVLRPASSVYAAAAAANSWLRTRRVQSLPATVISVGNITCGGTGKTPVVAWLVNELSAAGHTPGILSRGYAALDDTTNDERLVLDALCPGVPHVQQRDRIAGGRALIAAGCDVLVLDDGFQYCQLDRQLDLVVIDALQPWGFGHCLPRGLLRETPRSLRRADAVLINRADELTSHACDALISQIEQHTTAPIMTARVRPTRLVNPPGETASLDQLRDRATQPFCGLGNPDGFAATLRSLGVETAPLAFPDHHHYTAADREQLRATAKASGAVQFVCTQKDLVKLPEATIAGRPVWAVEIALDPITRCDPVEAILRPAVAGRIAA